MTAIAANDVWAIGETYSNQKFLPLLMHWDGTEWKMVVDEAGAKWPDRGFNAIVALNE